MPRFYTRQSPGIEFHGDKHGVEEYTHRDNPEISGPTWKLDVGDDLNNLLDIAEELMRNPDAVWGGDEVAQRSNRDMFESIHNIVDRVAEFEDIQAKPEEES